MPMKLHLSGVVCTTVELLKKSDCLVEIWRGASSLPAKSRRRPRCCTNPFSRTVWQTLGISGRFCWQIDKRGSSRCCQYASYGDGAVPCSSPPRHQAPVCNTQKKTYCTNFTHFTYVPQPGVGWGGGVGWGAMTCTVMHTIALAHMLDATQLHLRTCWMLRNSLAHTFDATQLHLRTCWMLRNCTCAHVGCYASALAHMLDATQFTCAHVRCYATALAHMLDATQLHLRTCWMLRHCTCAHVGCYAIALAHMLDATQFTCAHVRCYAIHLRTRSMLRNCTCAHVGCYALALAHMLDATQVHLRTCWMLRNSLAHMFDATQLHLRTCWMLRNCTCAHVGCYAIALALYMIYFYIYI